MQTMNGNKIILTTVYDDVDTLISYINTMDQIRKIAGCPCAVNAGSIFPAIDF